LVGVLWAGEPLSKNAEGHEAQGSQTYNFLFWPEKQNNNQPLKMGRT
jgi:hypothetical protein